MEDYFDELDENSDLDEFDAMPDFQEDDAEDLFGESRADFGRGGMGVVGLISGTSTNATLMDRILNHIGKHLQSSFFSYLSLSDHHTVKQWIKDTVPLYHLTAMNLWTLIYATLFLIKHNMNTQSVQTPRLYEYVKSVANHDHAHGLDITRVVYQLHQLRQRS